MTEEIQHEGPRSAQSADLPRSAMISIKDVKALSTHSAFLACGYICAAMGTQKFGRRVAWFVQQGERERICMKISNIDYCGLQ
jgi:L-cysteine desulfidase